MTKRRLITLLSGVAVLALASWWRLKEVGPKAPPLPSQGPPPALLAPRSQPNPALPSFSGTTMGTTFTVKYVPEKAIDNEVAKAAVQAALDDVVQSMSTYEPKSEISLFNAAEEDQPTPLGNEFAEVFRVAQSVHQVSEGAFDVTVGPLVEAYGFGSKDAKELPPSDELITLEESVGMNRLLFDAEAKTLQKTNSRVHLDFGGIAKGYGVDRAAAALEKLGVERYMVEVGGEIRVAGTKKNETPWTLAIEEPTKTGRKVHGMLRLDSGAALATSGDYRNFRSLNGEVVSHTFDPRTKRPVPHRTASVSVIRPTATEADALATAFTVMEPKEALRVANEHNYAVYLLTHKSGGGFESHASQAFEALDFELY